MLVLLVPLHQASKKINQSHLCVLFHRNAAFVRPKRVEYVEERPPPVAKKPNPEILEHEKKRAIEVKVLMWAEEQKFEERGFDEEEIERRKAEKRQELMKNQQEEEVIATTNTHKLQAMKDAEVKKLQEALGLKNYESMCFFSLGVCCCFFFFHCCDDDVDVDVLLHSWPGLGQGIPGGKEEGLAGEGTREREGCLPAAAGGEGSCA